MGWQDIINNIVDQKVLDLHCAYIAKVLSTDGKTAKIQPLDMMKQYGKAAQTQSVIEKVPIIQSARYKIKSERLTFLTSLAPTSETRDFAILTPLEAGDIVVCICADRDISNTKNGTVALPAHGSHSLSDSIIVGILNK